MTQSLEDARASRSIVSSDARAPGTHGEFHAFLALIGFN